jgi:hypothetical protein
MRSRFEDDSKAEELVYDSGFEFDFKISSCLAHLISEELFRAYRILKELTVFCISKSDSGYDLEVLRLKLVD